MCVRKVLGILTRVQEDLKDIPGTKPQGGFRELHDEGLGVSEIPYGTFWVLRGFQMSVRGFESFLTES